MITLFIFFFIILIINLFGKGFPKSFIINLQLFPKVEIKKSFEGFVKMMEGQTKGGANISVPALCKKRTVEYCETTEGCQWNSKKCELKKGWTTGSIGSVPIYVRRKCSDRKNPNRCTTTEGCELKNNSCVMRGGFMEVKNIDGEVIYVPGQCTNRTIEECGSGKNCIWVQGRCIRRDAGQRYTKLHENQKNCYVDHKGISFGNGMFICSDKPMPLKPSKMKSGIREEPASKKTDIPMIKETKKCLPPIKNCKKERPFSLLSGYMKKEEHMNIKANNYIKKLEDMVNEIKTAFGRCAVQCGKKPADCVDWKKGGKRCNKIQFNNKEKCENAFGGDVCRWADNEWKKCTPDCKKWNCENCVRAKERQKKKDEERQCVRNARMIPIPFERETKISHPRVAEMNINLNTNLMPYNQNNYVGVSQNMDSFNNCQFKSPITSMFNETFLGATKCELLGKNKLKCDSLQQCEWFADENSFRSSQLGKKWKEHNQEFERNNNVDEAIKYLYLNDPVVAKEFVKNLRLPANVKEDTFKMIDFLQTKQGKQWAEKRDSLSFNMWVMDYMVNFSSAQ